MSPFRSAMLGLLLILFAHSPANAADGSTFPKPSDIGQKYERKENSRWTLQDWLGNKQRNKLSDLWLAIYSPSPYEFFIGGAYQSYAVATIPTSTDDWFQSYSGSFGAYYKQSNLLATVLGFELDYENNTQEQYNDLSGSFHVQFFGNAVQGTHLSLLGGYRTRTIDTPGIHELLRNKFIGADLNLYITRNSGVSACYKYYIESSNGVYGTVSGDRSEAGLYLDFGVLRLFGNLFIDREHRYSPIDPNTSTKRSGLQSGLKFFF